LSHQKTLTKWHNILFQFTQIFNNMAVGTEISHNSWDFVRFDVVIDNKHTYYMWKREQFVYIMIYKYLKAMKLGGNAW